WNPDQIVVRHAGGANTWGDLFYRRSPDGGASWGAVNQLTTPGALAVRPAIAAFGNDVHLAWVDRRDAKAVWNFQIYYRRSTDGGLTWSSETRMTNRAEVSMHPQLVAPLPGFACLIYESGWVWDGSRYEGDVGLFVLRTTDGGRTWQGPRRLSFV